jgi:hypothetical protein
MTNTFDKAVDQLDGSVCSVETTVKQGLEAFQADMDAHLQRLREALTRSEADTVAKKSLCALLPDGLPAVPSSLRVGGAVYKADAELTFEGVSRTQALELFKTLPGVPVLYVSEGTSTYVPEVRFVPREPNTAKVTPVGTLVYRLDTWTQGLREEYSWWTLLGDALVYVKAYSGPATCYASAKALSVMLNSEQQETRWTYENLPTGEVVRWYGGDSRRVVPLTVHVSRDVNILESFMKPAVATAKVVKNKCDC